MTPKQLNNILALARMGFAQLAAEGKQSEEGMAEIAADIVAVKQFAATYQPPQPDAKPEP